MVKYIKIEASQGEASQGEALHGPMLVAYFESRVDSMRVMQSGFKSNTQLFQIFIIM